MSVESITAEEVREWFEVPYTRKMLREMRAYRDHAVLSYGGVSREDRLQFLDQMDGFSHAIEFIEGMKNIKESKNG